MRISRSALVALLAASFAACGNSSHPMSGGAGGTDAAVSGTGGAVAADAAASGTGGAGISSSGTTGGALATGGVTGGSPGSSTSSSADAASLVSDATPPPDRPTSPVDRPLVTDGPLDASISDLPRSEASETDAEGTDAGGANGPGPLVGACANLTCLNDLAKLEAACPTQGPCTEQTTTTGAVSYCYANGVKMQEVVNMSTMSAITSVKNGDSPCYSTTIKNAMVNPMVVTVYDSSGNLILTISVDSTNNAETTNGEIVTCPGGTPTVIDSTCGADSDAGSSSGSSGTTDTCAAGPCTY